MTKEIIETLNGQTLTGVIIVTFNYESEITKSKHPDFEDASYRVSYHKVETKIDNLIVDSFLKITTEEKVLEQVRIAKERLTAELKSRLKKYQQPTIQDKLKDLGFK